jgi:hypothetical protein
MAPMMKVLTEPFWEFIDKLQGEGKVTGAGVDDLKEPSLPGGLRGLSEGSAAQSSTTLLNDHSDRVLESAL